MNIPLIKLFTSLVIANFLNLIIATIVSFFGYTFSDSFVTLFLIEGAIMLIYGSLQELRGTILVSQIRKEIFHQGEGYSPDYHKKGREKAKIYLALGAFLIVESILISLLIVSLSLS